MLKVESVYKSYKKQNCSIFSSKKQEILHDISFQLQCGECLGLIGESGSGKSTLSRLILNLERPDFGKITMEGQPIQNWLESHRGEMSVVFQDYTTSINPFFTIEESVAEPIRRSKCKYDKQVVAAMVLHLLEKVQLSSRLLMRHPHELSGGQLQRVCIARAIATQPRFVVFDEALSSLDVSAQTQTLLLLKQLKQEMNMSYLFIAHDLPTITSLCNKLLFLSKGKIVEKIEVQKISQVQTPYAKKLLASVLPFD
ncbi:nickel transport system ATP-binding protein [Propionispira arboris]|uniref:Nickel transport system ATP-binding protein n=1 Tax=Propionispira arboris TaxID=84035 RepID=A0A1H7C818_9FIRM|nr:dipeptide/oligopeptide/nickel ABC transporter ATP-binding protein [Propionispira arboris]SEJ86023.1 nickel transport system ATP-binding protein [Propionispira arboris]